MLRWNRGSLKTLARCASEDKRVGHASTNPLLASRAIVPGSCNAIYDCPKSRVRIRESDIVKNSPEPAGSLASAAASARQILLRRFTRGRKEFTTDDLRDALAENGGFVNSVISSFVDEGLIEEQKVALPHGASAGLFGLNPVTWQILPAILEEVASAHLGLTIDETRMTIHRPGTCRHIVSLSPIQLKLAVALCEAAEDGIKGSEATALRGGDRTGERQFRIAFNRCLSVLGVKLDRFAWRLVAK